MWAKSSNNVTKMIIVRCILRIEHILASLLKPDHWLRTCDNMLSVWRTCRRHKFCHCCRARMDGSISQVFELVAGSTALCDMVSLSSSVNVCFFPFMSSCLWSWSNQCWTKEHVEPCQLPSCPSLALVTCVSSCDASSVAIADLAHDKIPSCVLHATEDGSKEKKAMRHLYLTLSQEIVAKTVW